MTPHEIEQIAKAVARELHGTHPCRFGFDRDRAATLIGLADAMTATKKIAGHTAVAALVLAFITVFILGFKAKILSWL